MNLSRLRALAEKAGPAYEIKLYPDQVLALVEAVEAAILTAKETPGCQCDGCHQRATLLVPALAVFEEEA